MSRCKLVKTKTKTFNSSFIVEFDLTDFVNDDQFEFLIKGLRDMEGNYKCIKDLAKIISKK